MHLFYPSSKASKAHCHTEQQLVCMQLLVSLLILGKFVIKPSYFLKIISQSKLPMAERH